MSQFIWGADPDTPHKQYVISVGNPILKFLPWKYDSRNMMALTDAEKRQQVFGKVRGYNIFLFAQWFNPERSRWENVTPRTRNPNFTEAKQEAIYAASFYLHHKININEPKFNRYREQDYIDNPHLDVEPSR